MFGNLTKPSSLYVNLNNLYNRAADRILCGPLFCCSNAMSQSLVRQAWFVERAGVWSDLK